VLATSANSSNLLHKIILSADVGYLLFTINVATYALRSNSCSYYVNCVAVLASLKRLQDVVSYRPWAVEPTKCKKLNSQSYTTTLLSGIDYLWERFHHVSMVSLSVA